MKTYISKPVEVKAELFNPDRIEEYRKMGATIIKGRPSLAGIDYWLETLEDYSKITIGDYLVIGTKGEFYPCKKDIFEGKYISKD